MALPVIATIAAIDGTAYARNAEGELRELRVGDPLRQGETLVTPEGSSVELELVDGQLLVIAELPELTLDQDMLAGDAARAEEASVDQGTLDALITALDGGNDLAAVLEPTAAGSDGTNAGSTFVRLGRIVEHTPEFSSLRDASGADATVFVEQAEPIPGAQLQPDSATTPEAQPVTIAVLDNDDYVEGAVISALGTPANGVATINEDGTVTYKPNPGFTGEDSFTYTTLTPDGTVTGTTTVNITVTPDAAPPAPIEPPVPAPAPDPVEPAPEPAPEAPLPVIALGDSTVLEGNIAQVTVTLSAASADTVTVSFASADDTATAVGGDYDPVSGTLTFAPGETEKTVLVQTNTDDLVEGTEFLNLELTAPAGAVISDGTGVIEITDGTVPETPTPPAPPAPPPPPPENEPPVTQGDSAQTGENTPVDINILGNDADPDGSLVPGSVAIITQPENGTVTVDPVTGEVTYTPDQNYSGTDSFTYTVQDDDGATSNTATVALVVNEGREIAQFTDNWVNGVEYTTYDSSGAITGSGLTGDQGSPGSFAYDEGERIVFKVGNVTVAEFNAGEAAQWLDNAVLFIHDFATGGDLTDTNAGYLENTAIFLQALDDNLTDGDLADGLQTNEVSNSPAAFADGINISQATRDAFADYEVDANGRAAAPGTGQPLNLATSGKVMIQDALAHVGIEFTRESEADPDPGDGRQNVFETIAMQHVQDTVDDLTEGTARDTDAADFDTRLEDVIDAADGVVTYLSRELDMTSANAEDQQIAFNATGLLANATPQQVSTTANMDIELTDDRNAYITLDDGSTKAVGTVVYDDDTRTGYIQLDPGAVSNEEIASGVLNTLSFEYRIWDWTANEVVNAKPLDLYKAKIITAIEDVPESADYSRFTLTHSLVGDLQAEDGSIFQADVFTSDQDLTVRFSPEGLAPAGQDFAEYADDFLVPIEYSTDGGSSWQAMDQVGNYTQPGYELPLPEFGFTWPAGVENIEIRIPIFDDVYDEPAGSGSDPQGIELIDITMGGNPNFFTENLQPGIIDNDPAYEGPVVEIDFVVVNEDAGTADLTISLVDQDGNAITAASDTSVTFETADLTASAGSDYQSTTGSVTILANESSATISIPIIDDFVIEPTEFALVNLTGVSTGNAVIGDPQGTIRIIDNDSKTQFSIDDVRVSEGGVAIFTVTRSGNLGTAQQITAATSLGAADTAEADDFTAASQAVSFAVGQATATFSVQTSADDVFEGPETFTVTLTDASSGAVVTEITTATGTGTIFDDGNGPDPDGEDGPALPDDDGPTLTIADASTEEGSGAVFAVTLDNASEAPVAITFTASVLAGDTAEVADFDPQQLTVSYSEEGTDTTITANADGSFTVPAGVTELSVSVPTIDDTVYEGDETFTLSAAIADTNYTATDTGTGTIVDDGSQPDGDDDNATADDDRPAFSIDDVTVNEDAGTIQFTVTKSGSTELAASVDYTVTEDTALEPEDFGASDALQGTLEFAAGEGSKTITLSVVDDALRELSESFDVTLSNARSAVIEDGAGVGTITDEDSPDSAFTLKLFAVLDDGEGGDSLAAANAINEEASAGATAGRYVVLAVDGSGTPLANADQPGGTVTVKVGADADTATRSIDYSTEASITATIGTVFTVSAIDDALADNGETFAMSLGSDWSRADEFETVTYSSSTVTTTINDSDVPPQAADDPGTGAGYSIAVGGGEDPTWTSSDSTGAQVAIAAFNADGSAGSVSNLASSSSAKLGVSANANGVVPEQLEYDADAGQSEALVFSFSGYLNQATVQTANLIAGEGSGERGVWVALVDGTVVAEGSVTTDNGGTLSINTGDKVFNQLRFEARSYTSDEAQKIDSDTSDYFVSSISGSGPAAANTPYTVSEDGTLSIDSSGGLLKNDADPQGDAISVITINPGSGSAQTVNVSGATSVTLASGALLSIKADGSFSYDPNGALDSLGAGVLATETFTYQIADEGGTSSNAAGGEGPSTDEDSVATVTITIVGKGEAYSVGPPSAINDSVSTDAGAPVTIDVLADNGAGADSDPDNDSLSVIDFTQPENGTVSQNDDGTLEYTPDDGFHGSDNFEYMIHDGTGLTHTATVTVEVLAADDEEDHSEADVDDDLNGPGSDQTDDDAEEPGDTDGDRTDDDAEEPGDTGGDRTDDDAEEPGDTGGDSTDDDAEASDDDSADATDDDGDDHGGDVTDDDAGDSDGNDGQSQQLPHGISHVKYLFTDDDSDEVYSVKLDNYGGDVKDPGDPQQYVAAIERALEDKLDRDVTFDAYYIKASTGVYDDQGTLQGSFDARNKSADNPLSNKSDYEYSTSGSVAPIALDLDGGGVEYLSREAGVVFTDQVTGEAVNTAWVAGDDGLLVVDANNSGTVDEAREYVFTEWSETAGTDMEAVAEVFDTNQNQMLDAGDEAWSQFAVWQDANSDGITDAGELVPLDDLGVESIALTYHDESEATEAADGDVKIFGQSEVTWEDGEVTIAEDTSFAINVADLIPEADGAEGIDAYLQASFDGTNTIVQVSKSGGFTGEGGAAAQVDQTITFEGVDLVGGLEGSDAIQAMIDAGKLNVDQ
jgi:hypothetical protein